MWSFWSCHEKWNSWHAIISVRMKSGGGTIVMRTVSLAMGTGVVLEMKTLQWMKQVLPLPQRSVIFITPNSSAEFFHHRSLRLLPWGPVDRGHGQAQGTSSRGATCIALIFPTKNTILSTDFSTWVTWGSSHIFPLTCSHFTNHFQPSNRPTNGPWKKIRPPDMEFVPASTKTKGWHDQPTAFSRDSMVDHGANCVTDFTLRRSPSNHWTVLDYQVELNSKKFCLRWNIKSNIFGSMGWNMQYEHDSLQLTLHSNDQKAFISLQKHGKNAGKDTMPHHNILYRNCARQTEMYLSTFCL